MAETGQDAATRLERLAGDIADFCGSPNNEDGYFSTEDADLLRAAARELRRLEADAASARIADRLEQVELQLRDAAQYSRRALWFQRELERIANLVRGIREGT